MNTQDLSQSLCDNNQISQVYQQFTALLNKILALLDQQLFEQLNQHILEKCRISTQKSHKVLAEIIETLVIRLVKRIQTQQSIIDMDITKSDYQILQKSLQKAQAQIRAMFKMYHQQKICQDDMQQKLNERERKIQQTNQTIQSLNSIIQRYQKQKWEMIKKIEMYQEKLYSIQRQNRWVTADKSAENLLVHKASLHFKDKNKLQPYLQNISKSKQILVRRKQTSKMLKDKASKILCFQSTKDQHQSNQQEITLKYNSSISLQRNKLRAGNSLSQLNSSIAAQQPAKKKKNRVLRNVTQIGAN